MEVRVRSSKNEADTVEIILESRRHDLDIRIDILQIYSLSADTVLFFCCEIGEKMLTGSDFNLLNGKMESLNASSLHAVMQILKRNRQRLTYGP